MTFRLGLTGSIGMGKSTTAAMFAEAGVPVWDADAVVHKLYGPGQAAALAIAKLFPEAINTDQSVNRPMLRALIQADPKVLDRINTVVHPLVSADRSAFLKANAAAPVILLDIPLLFETGLQGLCDAVAVVTAPADVQRERVLQRGLPVKDFETILARQMPDEEKRALADFIIPTTSIEAAKAVVKDVLSEIRRRVGSNA